VPSVAEFISFAHESTTVSESPIPDLVGRSPIALDISKPEFVGGPTEKFSDRPADPDDRRVGVEAYSDTSE
jgi:hypothetical protein